MKQVTIVVSLVSSDNYIAYESNLGPEQGYAGVSPDEALGHLIRELWLSDRFPCVVADVVFPDND